MTATLSKGEIRVGRDFVEAVMGTPRSHGKISLRRAAGDPLEYTWVSTQVIAVTERILRDCAAREKLRVVSFQSQAL